MSRARRITIAVYQGGMFEEGKGEILACCLCGERDYARLHVQRLCLGVGMSGETYTFCRRCWQGRTLGDRLLRLVEYPDGLRLLAERVELRDEAR